jgi:hypothetical protein
MFKPLVAPCLVAVLVAGCAIEEEEPDIGSASPALITSEIEIPYNEAQMTSAHNAFWSNGDAVDGTIPIIDALLFHGIRSFELDIVPYRDDVGDVGSNVSLPTNTRTDDWFVYHEIDGYFDEIATRCNRLSDCLSQLQTFHRMAPNHSVVTVFLDLKQSMWSTGGEPDDLDQLLSSMFPGAIYTPNEQLNRCNTCQGGCQSIQEASNQCRWPSVDQLRGKIVFVLTGSTDDLETYAGHYAGKDANEWEINTSATHPTRRAFVAPRRYYRCKIRDLSSKCTSWERSLPQWATMVNFNDSVDIDGEELDAHAAGIVTRVWHKPWPTGATGMDDEDEWNDAIANKINHIAIDNIHILQQPERNTTNQYGYPFRSTEDTVPSNWVGPAYERTSFGIEARTNGTIGSPSNNEDDFVFLADTASVSGDLTHTLIAHVSNANVGVEQYARNCIMARRTRWEHAPFFAVCRRGNSRESFAVWRTAYGAGRGTSYRTRVPAHGWEENSSNPALVPYTNQGKLARQDHQSYLKLVVRGACASGYVSHDGQIWTAIAENVCMQYPPALYGVAVAGYEGTSASAGRAGAGSVRGLFSDVRLLTRVGRFAPTIERKTCPSDFDYVWSIGSVPYRSLFSGFGSGSSSFCQGGRL